MSLIIRLPEHLASQRILAGIEFTDGIATVDSIGSNTRRFLEITGANFGDAESASPSPDELTVGTMQVGDRLLTDLTVDELRGLAETEGIDLPSKARKPEILNAFLQAFTREE